MSKKKIGIIIAAVVIIAAVGGGAWFLLKGNIGVGNSADKVYVEKVSTLNSANSGVQNRYSGVVEAQESWKVNKEADREVKEVFVEQGDMVEEGDPLFEYDMEDVEAELSQAKLDLEGMQNEISDYRNQIDQLTKERNAASADEKYRYTADIQEKETSIKQIEYNIESKKAEMEKKQESIDNAVVTSKIAGVVKSINESGGSEYASEEESAYMTVLAVGDFRVKGTISESNVQMLSEQQQVILRSRVDEEQTWTGTISKIDTQNEASDGSNDMYMYDSGGGAEKATKYPFYVSLDSTDNLMMGQHLFIELDEGQTEEKEGIWLFEGYIVREGADANMSSDGEELNADMDSDGESSDMDADGESSDMDADGESSDMDSDGASAEPQTAYVWAANNRNKLEKRPVELGEYDEATGEYEILSGLTEDDYIAFPMEGLYEGITTVTNMEDVDYTSPLYNQGQDGEQIEDGDMPADDELYDGEEGFDEGISDGSLSDMPDDESLSDMLDDESLSDMLDDESQDDSALSRELLDRAADDISGVKLGDSAIEPEG